MSEDYDNKELRKAWDRIARTADGLVVYRHLQKICMEKPPSLDVSALPYHEGRRSVAFDLMMNMSDGIGDYDRSCVTFRAAKPEPEPERTRRGPERRVTLDDAERVGNTELDKQLAAAIFKPPGASNGGAGGDAT